MKTLEVIIGIVAAIIGFAKTVDTWIIPKVRKLIQARKIPIINKVYAPLDDIDGLPILYRGMALGVEGSNINKDIEKNSILFLQQDGSNTIKTIKIEGADITGGSHAPGPTVLTIPVSDHLLIGNGQLSIRIGEKESNNLIFKVVEKMLPPTLWGFGTRFASKRSSSGAHGKRIVIGGFGFSFKKSENKVIFCSKNGLEKISEPEIVRGDALLGVIVPEGLPNETVEVLVYTIIKGQQSPLSNSLKFTIVPPPKLTKINPYARPGDELSIYGTNFNDQNEENNWVIIEPYQERKPVYLHANRVPTQNEIVVQIPKINIEPGPYDVRVVVDGNYSINTLILDIQKGK